MNILNGMLCLFIRTYHTIKIIGFEIVQQKYFSTENNKSNASNIASLVVSAAMVTKRVK